MIQSVKNKNSFAIDPETFILGSNVKLLNVKEIKKVEIPETM